MSSIFYWSVHEEIYRCQLLKMVKGIVGGEKWVKYECEEGGDDK